MSLCSGCEEILVLVEKTEEGVSSSKVFLSEFHHAIPFILELRGEGGDVFNIDFFRWGECGSSLKIGIRIGYEVLQFFFSLECVYFAIK